MAPGFGIGALEDLDAEDEDIYDTGSDFSVPEFVHYMDWKSNHRIVKVISRILSKKG